MKACGGAAKGLRFDHKLVRMTPPGLGLMREEMCGKTIQLKLRCVESSTPQPLTTGCRKQVPAATDQQLPAFCQNELKKPKHCCCAFCHVEKKQLFSD